MSMGILKKFMSFGILTALVWTSPVFAAGKGGGSGSGSKSLENAKSVKYKAKTEVNFDDATIEGSVRTPFGQGISSRDQKFDSNFVKIRKNFHDQMLLSTGGISP